MSLCKLKPKIRSRLQEICDSRQIEPNRLPPSVQQAILGELRAFMGELGVDLQLLPFFILNYMKRGCKQPQADTGGPCSSLCAT
jgi:hypothetical protein